MRTSHILGLCGLLGLLGCSSESMVTHTLDVTAYGEEYIEQGIPNDDTADGWSITFTKFEVTFTDVSIEGQDVDVDEPVALTHKTEGQGRVLGTLEVEEGEVSDATFTIAKLDIEGSATDGNETKTFAWTFDGPVVYDECEPGPDVEDGKSVAFQITVHADHLFYDSLVSETPDIRFAALAAADEDDNGEITRAELEDVTNLGAYDAGSEGADNLWSYLTALSKTLGHVNGEGHCHAATPRD